MKSVLPILAMVSTAGAILLMLVFHLAGAANASARQIRTMKLQAGGLSVLAVTCLIAGIVLLLNGQTGWAAAVSFFPTVIIGVLFLIAML